MRKHPRKLALNSETVRTLDRNELARAVGGSDSPNAFGTTQSGINCPVQAVVVMPK